MPDKFSAFSQLCSQGKILKVLKEPNIKPVIGQGSDAYKISTFISALFLMALWFFQKEVLGILHVAYELFFLR